ncbi:MAG: DUF1353 domain-containing protein [Minwuia sp.]|nr:DUF1353 domain-containing protein [Minwuia sp.]
MAEQPAELIDQDITSITQARFQSAMQWQELSAEERRRRREMRRQSWLPPGLLSPEWVLSTAMRYGVGSPDSSELYIVPRGYEFDGASVPWPLTAIVPKTHSTYIGAAALHDFLYEKAWESVPRERADSIFREAMLVLGLNWIWAGLMWRAVRAGGWRVWYRRSGVGFAGWFMRLPIAIRILPELLAVIVSGLLGALLVDLPRLASYRQQALDIADRDRQRDSSERPG